MGLLAWLSTASIPVSSTYSAFVSLLPHVGTLRSEADNDLVTPSQQATFFDNAQPSLSSPQFAAYLPSERDGAYDFGALDSNKYSGTIQYASVDSSNGFWEFPSTSYKVGSQTYNSSGTTGIAGQFLPHTFSPLRKLL
jgi:hypothetical protein